MAPTLWRFQGKQATWSWLVSVQKSWNPQKFWRHKRKILYPEQGWIHYEQILIMVSKIWNTLIQPTNRPPKWLSCCISCKTYFWTRKTVSQAFTVKTDNSKLVLVKGLKPVVSGHHHILGKNLSTNHVGLTAILSVATTIMRQNKFSKIGVHVRGTQ
jgi:hypothetical protein